MNITQSEKIITLLSELRSVERVVNEIWAGECSSSENVIITNFFCKRQDTDQATPEEGSHLNLPYWMSPICVQYDIFSTLMLLSL